jgi:hypothetical protein
MPPAARIAHGGDVIDVDAEADRLTQWHEIAPLPYPILPNFRFLGQARV